MRRLDYLLNTSKGNYQAHINRFLRRMRFEIEQEPCSKKSMREPEKRDFHEQVNAYMQTKNRRSFRGPVIMQLDFFPSKGNPPSIQHLTKNYIDLLYRRSTQQHYKFPLLDDRQISILIVNYHVQFPVKNPNIKISMTSLGDYIKDLKLLSLVKSGHI